VDVGRPRSRAPEEGERHQERQDYGCAAAHAQLASPGDHMQIASAERTAAEGGAAFSTEPYPGWSGITYGFPHEDRTRPHVPGQLDLGPWRWLDENADRFFLPPTLLDAAPHHVAILPGPTTWPLWAAFGAGTAFLGAMVHLLLVPVGGLLFLVAVIGWLWPRQDARPA
jgi:hypothetical protein